MIHLDAARFAELKRVNLEVNAYPAISDLAQYGELEHWGRMGLKGDDCDGYAMEKQARLRVLGWPAQALRLAVCTYQGDGHCVLTVDTDAGCYALDNRYADPTPWRLLPYAWLERQAADGPGWVAILDDTH